MDRSPTKGRSGIVLKANSSRAEIALLKYSQWGACITYQNTEK